MKRHPLRMGRTTMRGMFVLALGSVGLLLSVSNGQAQTFKNSNFKGRYICRSSSDVNFEESVTLLNPDGKGKFKDGHKGLVSVDFEDSTLVSGCTAKAGSSQSCPCVFTLDPSSSYAVTSDGTATASLVWIAAGTNDAACPTSPSFTLVDQLNLVLAQGGTTLVMDGNNNGFEEEPGLGSCTRTGTQ
jgi:hypothetical protein